MATTAQDQPESTNEQSAVEVEQLVVFTVDREEYAVPISDIREVLDASDINPVPDSPVFVLGIMNLRGKVVPIIDLEKRLHLQRQTDEKKRHIVITDFDSGLIGIQVDAVKEVLKVSKQAIQAVPSVITSRISPEFLRGVVVMARASEALAQEGDPSEAEKVQKDSRVLLLLELRKIISPEELQNIGPSEAEPSSQDNREETAS